MRPDGRVADDVVDEVVDDGCATGGLGVPPGPACCDPEFDPTMSESNAPIDVRIAAMVSQRHRGTDNHNLWAVIQSVLSVPMTGSDRLYGGGDILVGDGL